MASTETHNQVTRVSARLPFNDEHIAKDGKLPNGLGLPIRIQFEGEPVGRVVDWRDLGDGTAQAVMEVSLSKDYLQDACFGLDATIRTDGEIVETYSRLTAIGVWPDGTRPRDTFPHFSDAPEAPDAA